MKNRIIKTLIAFVLLFAVCFYSTAIYTSAISVYAVGTYPILDEEGVAVYADGLKLIIDESEDGRVLVYYMVDAQEIAPFETDVPNFNEYEFYGGGTGESEDETVIQVNGGNVYKIYGAGAEEANVLSSYISIYGGSVGTIYGGGYHSEATEYTVIEIYDGSIGSIYMGGYHESGEEYTLPSSMVMIYGGEITGSVYASGAGGEMSILENSDGTSIQIALGYDEYGYQEAEGTTLYLSGANTTIGENGGEITAISISDNSYIELSGSRNSGAVMYLAEYPSIVVGEQDSYDNIVDDNIDGILQHFIYDESNYDLVYSESNHTISLEKKESSKTNIIISEEFTGNDGSGDSGMTDEEKEILQEYDNITKGEDGLYYVEGKYHGGVYETAGDAKIAAEMDKAKEDAETNVANFEEQTFAGTGIEDNYGKDLYQEEIAGITQTENGGYEVYGEEYATIEEATNAVAEKVKEDTYNRNKIILFENLSTSAHYCDDSSVQEMYASGAVAIETLEYANADQLAEIYQSALNTISVGKNILLAIEDIQSVYDMLLESGVLTEISELLLEDYLAEIIENLQSAITNSEIDQMKSEFEKYILSLDVNKISLTDEDGNILVVITQKMGMSGENTVLLQEKTDTSEYTALLEYLQASGEYTAGDLLAKLSNTSKTLQEMQVYGAYDISISQSGEDCVKYTVKMIAPDGMEDVGVVKILHITDDGIELLSGKIVDGYIIWNTTSFSEFVILGKEAVNILWGLIPLSILAVLIFAYIFVSKKEDKEETASGKQQ